MIRNLPNYLDLPPEDTRDAAALKAPVVIIPVPFDKTSTWKKGAHRGPRRILEASCHLELYDIETDSEAWLQGIHTHRSKLKIGSPGEMVRSVQEVVGGYTACKKLPVLIGGEHSVTIGAVYGVLNTHSDIGVLQLDAHTDLRDTYKGSVFNHACVMARVAEKCPIVQVGIRSMDVSEKKNADLKRIFFARDIQGPPDWIQKALDMLPDKVYITLDLDAFDPSILPSTGTPEPGGLSWYQVTTLLKAAFRKKEIVGCDVVELCPGPDYSSDFLAAKLIYKMISYYFYFQKNAI